MSMATSTRPSRLITPWRTCRNPTPRAPPATLWAGLCPAVTWCCAIRAVQPRGLLAACGGGGLLPEPGAQFGARRQGCVPARSCGGGTAASARAWRHIPPAVIIVPTSARQSPAGAVAHPSRLMTPMSALLGTESEPWRWSLHWSASHAASSRSAGAPSRRGCRPCALMKSCSST